MTLPALITSAARSLRCRGPPTGISAPSSRTSTGPRTWISMNATPTSTGQRHPEPARSRFAIDRRLRAGRILRAGHVVRLALEKELGPLASSEVAPGSLARSHPPHRRVEIPNHHAVESRVGGHRNRAVRRERIGSDRRTDGLPRLDVPEL